MATATVRRRAAQAVVRGAETWVLLKTGQNGEVNGGFLCHFRFPETRLCHTCLSSKSMLRTQVNFVVFQKCRVLHIHGTCYCISQCLSVQGRISIPASTPPSRVPLLNMTWKCKWLGLKEDPGYVTAMLFLDYATPNAEHKKKKNAYLTRCDCFLCVSISFLCCKKSLQYLTGRERSSADPSLHYCSFAAGRC